MRGHITRRGSKTSWTVVLNLGYDPLTGKRLQKWIVDKVVYSVHAEAFHGEVFLDTILETRPAGVAQW